MTRKEKGNKLEEWVAYKLRMAGYNNVRPTRGSGNKTEIGDIYCLRFFVECKSKDKKNIVLGMNVIEHLLNQIPINSDRTPFWVYENKNGKKYVITIADDFFRLLKKVQNYEEKNND